MIFRCKRRQRPSGGASEAEATSSPEAKSPNLRILKPRKSSYSTTPQPFLGLPSSQNFIFDNQGSSDHAQGPLTPNRNNHGDLEQGADPFEDPVAAVIFSDNYHVQEKKDIADFQSVENPFETDSQGLSVLAQSGESLTDERSRPEEKRRTPFFIYTLTSRQDYPSSAPPSYRSRGD